MMLSAYSFPYLSATPSSQMERQQSPSELVQTRNNTSSTSSCAMDEFSLFMSGEANSVVIPLDDETSPSDFSSPDLTSSAANIQPIQIQSEAKDDALPDSITDIASMYFNEEQSTFPVATAVKSLDQTSDQLFDSKSKDKIVHRVSLPMSSNNSVASVSSSSTEETHSTGAPKFSSEEMFQKILKSHNERGNVSDENGFLPIHSACRHFPDNAKLIGMILRSNPTTARKPVKCPAKESPSSRKRRSCGDGSQPTKKIRTFSGSSNSSSSRIQIVSNSETYNYNGAYPLHIAIENGASLDVIKLLARFAPDVLMNSDGMGSVPLSLALKANASSDIVNLLLSMNSCAAFVPDHRFNLPLHVACMSPFGRESKKSRRAAYCLETLSALLSAFPQAAHTSNFNGKTPIELAENGGLFDDDAISLLHENAFSENEGDIQEVPWL